MYLLGLSDAPAAADIPPAVAVPAETHGPVDMPGAILVTC